MSLTNLCLCVILAIVIRKVVDQSTLLIKLISLSLT
nr:MAG TPA: hypothetical protein [Bacteriophage sp.]